MPCSFTAGKQVSLYKPKSTHAIMLRSLSIRHFAIVEALELDFEPGFTAITGETGAGKSILIDAMGLLLGDRADSSLIAAGQDQAELSASFDLSRQADARDWLSEQAMIEGDELLIRRLLSRRGASRAWINGRPATIGQLAELGAMLVEIHGQHEHQQLNQPDRQRQLLDHHLDKKLLDEVRSAWSAWKTAGQALKTLESESGDPAQADLLRFQCQELEDLGLGNDEFAELEREQERLARSDEIRAAMTRAGALLDQDDQPSIRAMLIEALQAMANVRSLDPGLASAASMLEEARINIDEAIAELERHDGSEEADPARLDQVNRRLQKVLDLARKHRVAPDALPALAESFRSRLDRVEGANQERQRLDEALQESQANWRAAAVRLTKARQRAASALAQEISRSLKQLGMDRAGLEIEVEPDENAAPSAHGRDRITILLSANPGQPPQPLARVASGGELSRVSLALMLAAALEDNPKVRVFDEVDAGIGGETAGVVGRFLKRVANHGQAFCVTHLAQVAARADQQISVRKALANKRTELTASSLDQADRQREIARMLGNPDSRRSLDHASELLDDDGV